MSKRPIHDGGGGELTTHAHYEAVDERAVRGSVVRPGAIQHSLRSSWRRAQVSENVRCCCGSHFRTMQGAAAKVAELVQSLVCEEQPMDYTLKFRVYGIDGVRMLGA